MFDVFYSPHISEQSGKTQQAGNENEKKRGSFSRGLVVHLDTS